jgi:hypothetical protein
VRYELVRLDRFVRRTSYGNLNCFLKCAMDAPVWYNWRASNKKYRPKGSADERTQFLVRCRIIYFE